MSVLFHIATRLDWDRVVSTGSYTAGSLDGVIVCTTAARHAAVANARFAGRTDLVLLLFDGDRLASRPAGNRWTVPPV